MPEDGDILETVYYFMSRVSLSSAAHNGASFYHHRNENHASSLPQQSMWPPRGLQLLCGIRPVVNTLTDTTPAQVCEAAGASVHDFSRIIKAPRYRDGVIRK